MCGHRHRCKWHGIKYKTILYPSTCKHNNCILFDALDWFLVAHMNICPCPCLCPCNNQHAIAFHLYLPICRAVHVNYLDTASTRRQRLPWEWDNNKYWYLLLFTDDFLVNEKEARRVRCRSQNRNNELVCKRNHWQKGKRLRTNAK